MLGQDPFEQRDEDPLLQKQRRRSDRGDVRWSMTLFLICLLAIGEAERVQRIEFDGWRWCHLRPSFALDSR